MSTKQEHKQSPRCLLPGTVLAERYKINKVVGEGAFGITYMGEDTLLDLTVALKEFYPSDMVSRDVIRGSDTNVYFYEQINKEEYDNYLNRFLNEAKCLSKFNDVSGIVSVRDFFYENNTAYIVMDYLDGVSVNEYIKSNGPMNSKEVLTLMRPVLKAMAGVHKTGLIHRDISPDNLLFTQKGELVLIDFGLARVRNVELTRSLTVAFKRGFSPEEQYRSRGKQGPWSDIYALCTTMYFMMTGKVPEEAVERLYGTKLCPISEFKNVQLSERQAQGIMKGASVKAEERYQSIEQLLFDLYDQDEIAEKQFEAELAHKDNSVFVVKKRNIWLTVACLIVGILVGTIFWQYDGFKREAVDDTIFRKQTAQNVKSSANQQDTVQSKIIKTTESSGVIQKVEETEKAKHAEKPKATEHPKSTENSKSTAKTKNIVTSNKTKKKPKPTDKPKRKTRSQSKKSSKTTNKKKNSVTSLKQKKKIKKAFTATID